MEGFLIRRLKIYESVLMGAASLSMLWPIYWLSIVGAAVFLVMLGLQWLEQRKNDVAMAVPYDSSLPSRVKM
jgi:TRAP-type uncharacterized transport system fused permease subunit